MNRKDRCRFYFIMGSQDVPPGKEPLEVLEEALGAGVTCFQLREKGPGSKQGKEKEQFARQCQELCRRYHVPFIINDDADLALLLKADGVHLGQGDLAVSQWRQSKGEQQLLLGRSTHNEQEVAAAVEDGADYVGLGALYPSRTKKDTLHQLTSAGIARIMERFPDFPIVGIGGITEERIEEVFSQGFSGVAMISTLAQAESITDAMRRIQDAAARGEESYQKRMEDKRKVVKSNEESFASIE